MSIYDFGFEKSHLNIMTLFDRLKANALFRDSFWALTGNAIGKGLALIAGIAIARILGSEAYGEYGLIKGTLLSIAIFSSFGLGYTATKFIAESKDDKPRILHIHDISTKVTLYSSGAIAIIVAIFASAIAKWLDDVSLTSLLRWSSIAIVLNALITTQNGELSGFRAYKTVARNNTISGILTFFCVTPAAYLGGLEWAIIALVFTLVCNCFINIQSLRRLLIGKSDYSILNVGLRREILSFSFPVALQEGLYSVTSWLGMAMLIKLASYSELGVYSAANQWMAVMLFVPGALRNVALSHLSENSNNHVAANQITKRLLLVNLVSTFIPFILIAVLSRWIASFYGQSFIGLPIVLNVCIFTAVVSSLTNVLTQELMAHSQNWFLFWTRFIRDAASLVLSYVAISYYRENAALCFAFSWLIMQVIYFIMLFIKRHQIYYTEYES